MGAYNWTGTAGADTIMLATYGQPGSSNTYTLNGLAGTDTLDFVMGNSFASKYVSTSFTIGAADASGMITVTGASSGGKDHFTFHLTSVESLKFADSTVTLSYAAADTTPPTVSSFIPAAGATGVTVASDIVINFSEAVQKGAGTIQIHTGSAAGTVVASYDAATSANLAVSGTTLTINPTADLANGTHYFVTLDAGSIKDAAGNSYAGTSSYDFTTAPIATTVLTGTTGNDTFTGGAGNETVIFTGTEANYTITKSGSGFTVKDNIGTDGTDTVINIEQLRFADHTLTIAASPGTILQESYRIYKAAFDRTPDYGGLGFWYNSMNQGTSIATVAEGFMQSTEFIAMYGSSPTDSNFLTLVYQHVLGRTYDQAGYNFWLGTLTSHANTQAQVLALVSESTENIANVAGVISNGIIYQAYVG